MPFFTADAGARLADLAGNLATATDVTQFLTQVTESKDNLLRVLAWLGAFKVVAIPSANLLVSLEALVTGYQSTAGQVLGAHIDCPTDALPPSEARLIPIDLQRATAWLTKLGSQLGLPAEKLSLAPLHLSRALALLSLHDGLTYIQGYDRYVSITYVLGLNFSESIGASPEFAETFAFELSRRLIRIAAPGTWLPTQAGLARQFRGLDDRIAELYPRVAGALRRTQQSGMLVAVRWELLIFADEHPLLPTLLIWDQVIARRIRGSAYIRALSLAHMGEVPIPADDAAVCEMQAPAVWDLPRIIERANALLDDGRPTFSWVSTALLAASIALSALSD